MLVYVYDEAGTPIGIKYRSTSYAEGVFDSYFFDKNLQGDIVAIYNASGTKIGTYTYDAWGNITQSTLSTNTVDKFIVSNNPFRYRGYYYDTDTTLYYLQSRYYKASWGRFLNADAVIGQVGNIHNNVFEYAFNNPTMFFDPIGNWPKPSTVFAVIALTALTVASVAAIVVSLGTAAPAVAVAGGNIVLGISTATVATATTIASVSLTIAGVSATASVSSYIVEETKEKNTERNNSVYVLKDEDGTVQYVGRTRDVPKRRAAHNRNPYRTGLKMEVIASGLNYSESRALEQAAMSYYHTVNKLNKRNNQINSISLIYWDDFKEIASGTLDYAWNQMTNEILYWAGN